MPKAPKSKKERTARVLYHLDIGNGAFRMHPDGAFCRVCTEVLTSTRKSSLKLHLATSKHRENSKRSLTQSQLSEVVLKETIDEFEEDVVKTFMIADIPLHKLNNAYVQSLFEKYAKKKLPSVFSARTKYVNKIYTERIKEISANLVGKKLWVS